MRRGVAPTRTVRRLSHHAADLACTKITRTKITGAARGRVTRRRRGRQAVWSQVWNEACSVRVRLLGARRVAAGDLVLLPEVSQPGRGCPAHTTQHLSRCCTTWDEGKPACSRDAAGPISTGSGTRRVHLVRGGGGHHAAAAPRVLPRGSCPALPQRGSGRGEPSSQRCDGDRRDQERGLTRPRRHGRGRSARPARGETSR